jgi:hypothetical protein
MLMPNHCHSVFLLTIVKYLNARHKKCRMRIGQKDIVKAALMALVQGRQGITSTTLSDRPIVVVVKIGMLCLFCYLLIHPVNLAPSHKLYIGFRSL